MIGLELVKEAVDSANENAKRNNLDAHVTFLQGKAEELFTRSEELRS